ncbi:MAG: competence/damage-inducible protein A [Clostridiales bacterium]|nr:competence/damage-inducible protein A [Clostridiales bacterium]
MNAEILAVGTELLMGQIANTNAQYISGRLPEAGINVYYHSVVGDNPVRLSECLKIALGRSDAVILTGGLGPTEDDLTKETVAAHFGLKLVLQEESLEKMIAFFNKLNRVMTNNNKKQALIPENSIIIKNKNGTAPGCIIEEAGKTVILLPGPPQEMKPMFDEYVMPYFASRSEKKLVSKYIRIFGIGESAMEEKIIDLIDQQGNPTIAPYAKEGEVTLRITAGCGREEDGEPFLAPVIAEIKRRLGDFIYSTENKSLDQVAGELLIATGTTLSVAESCTGGMISSRLTSIPGISAVFNRGIVAYSNEAKIDSLGVKRETIIKYGAVSRETVVEMAEGVRRLAGTRLGLAVTGIAGPGGGTDEKPVGMVFVALVDGISIEVKELKLWGDRDRIRNVTGLHCFDMIRRWVEAKKRSENEPELGRVAQRYE